MPIRKARNRKKWQVRRHVRQKVTSRSEGELFARLLESKIAEARRLWKERAAGCCSIGAKLEEFLSDSRMGLGRRSCDWKTLKRHKQRLTVFDKAFHSKPIDTVTRRTLERWIKRRLNRVKSPTVNMDLASLRAFARWAIKKGYAPAILPIMTVERLDEPGKLPGKNRLPPEVLEMGELRDGIAAIRAFRPDIALFIQGMAVYGLRPVEVAALRRDNYRPPQGGDNGRIHVKGVKKHPDRDIPIRNGSPGHGWAEACMALGVEAGRATGRWPLVPCLARGSRLRPGGWTSNSLGKALRRLCRRRGLSFRAYLARHTCISWLQTQGQSVAISQKYANHSKPTTTDTYSHRNPLDAMDAYDLVGEALGIGETPPEGHFA